MAPRKPTNLRVALSPEEKAALRSWRKTRSKKVDRRLKRRAHMILLVGEQKLSIKKIADTAHITRRHIYKWVRRFNELGIMGLIGRSSAHKKQSGQQPVSNAS